ncbi:hypothetical protein WI93_24670 [Burkholderia vietnamiensis]|uniref:hypothetical protein n=1 Tax=Burkholderia vietnamiensis TaxID=60552 RepID=UPI000752758B|nr:hypothetical protein [Burkholderia vietnamiensis]KVE33130.1 hypothetical protein WI93_24670 [Burkholderia vietnamiensis]KVE57219.1 hypothetical protein WI94_08895 [Burkholderia vietnamiensis]KVE88151.1 hypothetical protein WJ00_09270 [Burkholderia vietnamiensis]MDN7926765.1 hypothetical protein [Burkholderia vietnamiensis]HDR9250816.1 hypothetical protein [Burkholderia vietnamiensis]
MITQPTVAATLMKESFPFSIQHNTLNKPSRVRKADSALTVFEALWDAYQRKTLKAEDIQNTFFDSISDLISYRDGWKCGRYWSVDAWEKARLANGVTHNKLLAEHVLPRSAALFHALELPKEAAKKFVWDKSFYCTITEDEDGRLNKAGLKDQGNPVDPWQRYAKVNIVILDAEDQAGRKFIPDVERAHLKQLGILHPWEDRFRCRSSDLI